MILNETLLVNCKITESDRSKLPKGVLFRGVWPICNVDELNANGRIYERAVFEKVMDDPEIKAKHKNRNLYGHGEHPEGVKSDLMQTSHIITDTFFEAVEEDGKVVEKVFQEIEVLDTPHGRLIHTLIEANCMVGVSTRASGDVETITEGSATYDRVVPDKYKYITTDFTADPSTFGSIPTKLERNVVEAISDGCTTEDDARKISKELAESILAVLKSDEAKVLLESVKRPKINEDRINSYTLEASDPSVIDFLDGQKFKGLQIDIDKDNWSATIKSPYRMETVHAMLTSGSGSIPDAMDSMWELKDYIPDVEVDGEVSMKTESKTYTVKSLDESFDKEFEITLKEGLSGDSLLKALKENEQMAQILPDTQYSTNSTSDTIEIFKSDAVSPVIRLTTTTTSSIPVVTDVSQGEVPVEMEEEIEEEKDFNEKSEEIQDLETLEDVEEDEEKKESKKKKPIKSGYNKESKYVKIKDKIYERQMVVKPNVTCIGCKVEMKEGNLHTLGCLMEACPSCGESFSSCSCQKEYMSVIGESKVQKAVAPKIKGVIKESYYGLLDYFERLASGLEETSKKDKDDLSEGKASSGKKTKIHKNKDTGEFVVDVYIDGVKDETATYKTNNKDDAIAVQKSMEAGTSAEEVKKQKKESLDVSKLTYAQRADEAIKSDEISVLSEMINEMQTTINQLNERIDSTTKTNESQNKTILSRNSVIRELNAKLTETTSLYETKLKKLKTKATKIIETTKKSVEKLVREESLKNYLDIKSSFMGITLSESICELAKKAKTKDDIDCILEGNSHKFMLDLLMKPSYDELLIESTSDEESLIINKEITKHLSR
jgi:hypothetical protein